MDIDEVSFRDFFFEFFCKFLLLDYILSCLSHIWYHMIVPDRNIWTHFLSFYKRKDDPNVLWLFYEDLLADREKCIVKLAGWYIL